MYPATFAGRTWAINCIDGLLPEPWRTFWVLSPVSSIARASGPHVAGFIPRDAGIATGLADGADLAAGERGWSGVRDFASRGPPQEGTVRTYLVEHSRTVSRRARRRVRTSHGNKREQCQVSDESSHHPSFPATVLVRQILAVGDRVHRLC